MNPSRQNKQLWPLALMLAVGIILSFGRCASSEQPGYTITRSAAEQGDAQAQFELGRMHHDGNGAPQDYEEAVTWLQKAAEQGLAKAQNELGSMYASGQGVPKNIQQAADWYRKAAGQGLAEAQANLGFLYANGLGMPRNEVSAYAWYSLAADQGYQNAIQARDLTANRLTAEQRIQAIIHASELKTTIDGPPSTPQ